MEINNVLIQLYDLFSKWGLSSSDLIFTAQYADRLQGYDVPVRQGHFNIIARKEKIPWSTGDALETHPPLDSPSEKSYENFRNTTSFEFDITPLSNSDFEKYLHDTTFYSIDEQREIRVITPAGSCRQLDVILAMCNEQGWGTGKGIRILTYMEQFIQAAKKIGKTEEAQMYQNLYDAYKHLLVVEESVSNDSSVIAGLVACQGKVSGKARIITDLENMHTMQQGEILVTTMTSPHFTSILKKCAAIVTDEGGMLCHAAITARELKIPCIVGTQNATSLLTDGDLIEVDAEKGTVQLF